MEALQHVQWYDYVRLVTAVAALAAMFRLSRLIRNQSHHGQTYSTRLRDFLWLTYAFLFTQIAGALSAVLIDAPLNYGSLLSLTIALVAIHATRESDDPLIT